MISLDQIQSAWQQFFHAPESVAPLALFRIVWGLLLVANSLLLRKELSTLLGPEGYISAKVFEKTRKRRFCLLTWLPATNRSLYFVWGMNLLASVTLMAGFCTRTSALVAFLTLISLHHRNGYLWSGGDNLQRILNFLLIFSPAGQTLSVDAYLASGVGFDANVTADPWAWRLMQIQVSVLYLRSVFWKMRGHLWRNGKAVWYPIHADELSRARVPNWLVSTRIIAFVTWSTIAVQLAIGTGVWIEELVYPVLLAGVAMHLMLDVFLSLQLFSWTMMVTYLLFLRLDTVERVVSYVVTL